MPEQNSRKERVDRYVRDRMSAEEIEVFELELLESDPLQDELETVLAMRQSLAIEDQQSPESTAVAIQPNARREAPWQPLAMAAAVVLAVLSTVMWWRSGNQVADLERQVQSLGHPIAEVLTVAVPIMRSASAQTPDVIVQKPAGRSAILLDVELGLRAREQSVLDFALVDPQGETVLVWQAEPTAGGRATVVINSEKIPASKLWLQISAADGNVLERRLLEFRE